MSRPPLPPESELPESAVHQLHALYHAAATEQPGPQLDRRILDAARAELKTERATRRRAPWWQGWLPAAAAMAVVIVGLSVTWRVMDEQERRLREEMSAAAAAGETAAAAAPPAPPAEATAGVLDAPAPAAEKSRRVPAGAITKAPPGMPEPAATSVVAAPAATVSAPVEAEAKKGRRADRDDVRERGATSAAANSAGGPARAPGKLEAQSLGSAAAAADSAAQPAVDAATPAAWLQHIRALRAAGRNAEAAQSLARFRTRYPGLALPDDLLDLN